MTDEPQQEKDAHRSGVKNITSAEDTSQQEERTPPATASSTRNTLNTGDLLDNSQTKENREGNGSVTSDGDGINSTNNNGNNTNLIMQLELTDELKRARNSHCIYL